LTHKRLTPEEQQAEGARIAAAQAQCSETVRTTPHRSETSRIVSEAAEWASMLSSVLLHGFWMRWWPGYARRQQQQEQQQMLAACARVGELRGLSQEQVRHMMMTQGREHPYDLLTEEEVARLMRTAA
jgi:hypothetical protein